MNDLPTFIDLETLQGLEPIASLSYERIKALASRTPVEMLPAGSTLFSEGDEDQKMIFVIDGEIRLHSSRGAQPHFIRAGMPESWNPIANHHPRQMSAVTECSTEIIRIDIEEFDRILSWDQMAVTDENGERAAPSAGGNATAQMTQSATFESLPSANIEELFKRLEHIDTKAGEVIIRQGDLGDYYWLLDQGEVKVARQVEPGGAEVELATLGAGATFGEEALISDNPRNASVTMLTDGALRRLDKKDFIALLREPMVDWIELNQALAMLGDQGVFLDVRVAAEFKQGHLPQAVNTPLFELRQKVDGFDQSKHYICYCSTGRRSSAAAFLLKQNGFTASVLKGGLSRVPASFIIR